MKNLRFFFMLSSVLIVAALAASCGKSKNEPKTTAGRETTAARPVGKLAFTPILRAAGFEPVWERRFPAEMPGMKASVIAYRAQSGPAGGVVYVQDYGDSQRVVWQWYFPDAQPDSVTAVELNQDGLWDVRMFMKGGTTKDYIQDKSFTFFAPLRDDRIAMNGQSSDPQDDDVLWKAFDGDSTTAFVTSVGGYVQIPTPLGIQDGLLRVQLDAKDQPKKCDVEVDGKKVQDFELKQSTLTQTVQLDPSVKTAKSVRIVFDSAYGDANQVAISELGLR